MFSIGLVTNSYKYGSELQFLAFTRKPPTLERRVEKDHDYYRLECGYLPGTHGTAQQLRNIAYQIDAILSYNEPVVVYPGKTKEIKKLVDVMI